MSTPCHALVFRDVREQLCLCAVRQALEQDIQDFLTTGDRESLVSAFLRGGEVECSLADTGEDLSSSLTYLLSEALLDEEHPQRACQVALSLLRAEARTKALTVSRPEGVAFYGL